MPFQVTVLAIIPGIVTRWLFSVSNKIVRSPFGMNLPVADLEERRSLSAHVLVIPDDIVDFQ